jgi:GH15 family glucan-1,4-alpha-glucosidase
MRDRIRDYLLNEASPDGWFRQAAEVDAPDAAALLAPAFGFLAVSDPRVRATIDRVREELEHDGLVDRYRVPDGLAGGEGAFLLCSFWLVDCFTFAGELDRAGSLLDKLLGLANDVGLYAEEADVQTGAPLGNFPQAFTHMALVTSCAHLSAARRGQIPFGEPTDFAEHALHLLLSTTGRSPLTVAGPQRPPIRS